MPLLPSMLCERFTAAPGVHHQTLAGETVLLDVSSGIYFGINEVGSRVWELLARGATLAMTIDSLEAEFDVDCETLARDVAVFVQTLKARGLVTQYHR